MTPQELWQATLGELEILLSKANFTTWFKNTSIANYNEDKVIINVPNIFTKEYLAKKYHQVILKALKNITQNNNLKEIEYRIDSAAQNRNNYFTGGSVGLVNKQKTASSQPMAESISHILSQEGGESAAGKSPVIGTSKLNPKYTFTTFIVGRNSELAHAAALAVVKNPGNAYNPLFIYGGVGLGKTHLMQAIGNKILENNSKAKVLYTSCENFTNDFMMAVRAASENPKALQEFNDKYRSLDVFLIDDIQFLSGKERTEEAFFNIFN